MRGVRESVLYSVNRKEMLVEQDRFRAWFSTGGDTFDVLRNCRCIPLEIDIQGTARHTSARSIMYARSPRGCQTSKRCASMRGLIRFSSIRHSVGDGEDSSIML